MRGSRIFKGETSVKMLARGNAILLIGLFNSILLPIIFSLPPAASPATSRAWPPRRPSAAEEEKAPAGPGLLFLREARPSGGAGAQDGVARQHPLEYAGLVQHRDAL